MRRSRRHIATSFALACVAMAAPTSAAPLVRPPWSDTQIDLAGGGEQQRCWMAETPQGPQRRCRGGGSGGRESWSAGDGGNGHGERGDSGDRGSHGGWDGAYGGWNGGYSSGRGD